LFIATICLSISSYANHIVGGNLTWSCLGTGEYIFQVKITIDCNTNVLQPGVQQIKVWNHPTLISIPVLYVSETDISPICKTVNSGPSQISCNGQQAGSLKEFIYQSAPINITGVPPIGGFHFTYSNFSRGSNLANIQNPSTTGTTLHASMYSYNGQAADPCFDSSPKFTFNPINAVCLASLNIHSLGAIDVDSDSLVYSFAEPLNNDITTAYNPPVQPTYLPWANGYSATNSLPGNSINPSNLGPNINSQTGDISFEIYNSGYYLMVVNIESFRCGQKISEVSQEMVVNILPCSFSNFKPNININGATNQINVFAGDLVSFSLEASDFDLLQDGSPQSVEISASGEMFGTNFISSISGCDRPPCAVVNGGLVQSAISNLTIDFQWQTSCNHVAFECEENEHAYYFTFQTIDDVCEIPKHNIQTIQVNVMNVPPVSQPELRCASVDASGDVNISWLPVIDTSGSFVQYNIYSSSGGLFTLVGSETNINNPSFNHVGAGADLSSIRYLVSSVSSCGGYVEQFSLDTLNTIFLSVVNPSNGTAVLQWNDMTSPILSSANPYYYIYMEYPSGTWTLIDSTLLGNTYYIDTISICDAYLNYKIELSDQSGCVSASNIDGDQFQDALPPESPIITYVTIDTISGNAFIEWNPSSSQDASAYIIVQNINGFWQIIDTVYGYNTTTYLNSLSSNSSSQIDMYGIAAYDSCWSGTSNPNTSPVGNAHRTILLQNTYDICSRTINLSWNTYSSWANGVSFYNLYLSINNGSWSLLSQLTSNDSSFVHNNVLANSNYRYIVEAVENGSFISNSNINSRFTYQPSPPNFSYIQAVSVKSETEVEIRYLPDTSANIQGYELYKSDDMGISYYYIDQSNLSTNPIVFIDNDVDTKSQQYSYKVVVLDSCGRRADTSEFAQTILLMAEDESEILSNYIYWTTYFNWDANIDKFELYRKTDLYFDPTPIAILNSNKLNYTDDISNFIGTQTQGKFCYKILAYEKMNSYGIAEISESNEFCANQEPLIFVPNAICISGINNTWKPVVNLIDLSYYTVNIYNRLNHLVFQSSIIDEAWDGTYFNSNNFVPLGVYIYFIEFRSARGDYHRRQGHITVIR